MLLHSQEYRWCRFQRMPKLTPLTPRQRSEPIAQYRLAVLVEFGYIIRWLNTEACCENSAILLFGL